MNVYRACKQQWAKLNPTIIETMNIHDTRYKMDNSLPMCVVDALMIPAR
jgi:hypothetical protein